MEKTLQELKAEADILDIEYAKNITAAKLLEKIEEYYESQSAGDSVQVKEETEEVMPKKGKLSLQDSIVTAKAKAFETFVVTVTNNDPRENGVLEADYFGFENQYFGKSLLVPFNIPAELPRCIIDIIESTPLTIHADEYIDGRRTGNKMPRQVKKYNVSYGKPQ